MFSTFPYLHFIRRNLRESGRLASIISLSLRPTPTHFRVTGIPNCSGCDFAAASKQTSYLNGSTPIPVLLFTAWTATLTGPLSIDSRECGSSTNSPVTLATPFSFTSPADVAPTAFSLSADQAFADFMGKSECVFVEKVSISGGSKDSVTTLLSASPATAAATSLGVVSVAPGVFDSKESDNSPATSLNKLVIAVVVPIAAIAIGLICFFLIRSIRKKRRARAKAYHAAVREVNNPFSAGPGDIRLSQQPTVQIDGR